METVVYVCHICGTPIEDVEVGETHRTDSLEAIVITKTPDTLRPCGHRL